MSGECFGTGFQPAEGSVTIIRRQMLAHFPTVTQSAGFQPEPLLTTHCSVGYWLPASCEGLVLIRGQMLAHFPTVTQSTGFQPEPLLITQCLVWYWLPASCEGLVLIRRQMLSHFPTVTQSTGFQPEPLLTQVRSMSGKCCVLSDNAIAIVIAKIQSQCAARRFVPIVCHNGSSMFLTELTIYF